MPALLASFCLIYKNRSPYPLAGRNGPFLGVLALGFEARGCGGGASAGGVACFVGRVEVYVACAQDFGGTACFFESCRVGCGFCGLRALGRSGCFAGPAGSRLGGSLFGCGLGFGCGLIAMIVVVPVFVRVRRRGFDSAFGYAHETLNQLALVDAVLQVALRLAVGEDAASLLFVLALVAVQHGVDLARDLVLIYGDALVMSELLQHEAADHTLFGALVIALAPILFADAVEGEVLA